MGMHAKLGGAPLESDQVLEVMWLPFCLKVRPGASVEEGGTAMAFAAEKSARVLQVLVSSQTTKEMQD
jgi:hypothetical protein